MKTISVLSASVLAFLLYAFAPKPSSSAPASDTVIKVVETNSELILTNNEYIKTRIRLCDGTQKVAHYYIDSAVISPGYKAIVQE